MAQFNTDIVVRTLGRIDPSFTKVISKLEQVGALITTLQKKPLNIFGSSGGAGGDIAAKQLANFKKLTRDIANLDQTEEGAIQRTKLLGNTLSSTAEKAQAFAKALDNVNIAKQGPKKASIVSTQAAEVKTLGTAWANATIQAEKYQNRLARFKNDSLREAQGLQTQDARDAEIERRKRFVATEREKRRQAKLTADARIKEDKRVAKEVRKNEREAKQDRNKKQRERNSKLNNLGAAVGFPLLFGGGVGSVAGGAIGAAFGGFGGSIVGSALGQQFDALTAATITTAKAFEKLGSTANDLIPKLGRGVGNGFGGQSQFLIGEGRESQVAAILRERFAEVYGDEALKDFEKLAEINKEFEQTWNEIGVELQRLLSGPLGTFLEALKGISNGVSGRGNEGVDNRKELNDTYTKLQLQANKILGDGHFQLLV